MLVLGPIGFAAPWLLLALAALPILWFLLRAVPPAPLRRRFPGVVLLLGLTDDESQTDKTPWWLLLLRLLAVALVIVAFADPIANPDDEAPGRGPLLVVVDGSWASARDWTRAEDRLDGLLSEATRAGRSVAVANLTDLPAGPPEFLAADAWAARLPGLQPSPWEPDAEAVLAWAGALEGPFETYWMSDGLDRALRAPLLEILQDRGAVTVLESPRPVMGLRPATLEDGVMAVDALRAAGDGALSVRVVAVGPDPAGVQRPLATAPADFAAGETVATALFDLPVELRNRITRFEVEGVRSAGAVTLADDALRRREVALIAGTQDRETLELLSPLHYLEQALVPTADLIDGSIEDIILANPDVIVLADVATLAPAEGEALLDWVGRGGLLLRFAGPRLAASDLGRVEEDPLLPVRLRAGGRLVGGTMSWGEPKSLMAFPQGSPFEGLPIPGDVLVNAQVMAQPDPDLASRVIAQLTDGTPLVTRRAEGDGQIVLFHVTANAEWSTLPLSGLFVRMLERLAVSTRTDFGAREDIEGRIWSPEARLDGFGALDAAEQAAGIDGAVLALGPGPEAPPGLYASDGRQLALNVLGPEAELAPSAWPANVPVEGFAQDEEAPLKGWLLTAALVLLAADVLASLALAGRLFGPRSGAVALIALALVAQPPAAQAQDDVEALALTATSEVVLAYVLTGDARVDAISQAGLRGISQVLFARTSVEPAAPIAVDIERDELAFFPFLYWPITPDQAIPSREAYGKLNTYLRSGGMILFDTRDADTSGFGSASPEGQRLQVLARPLDIPPLEPLPPDHVLTRTFYLLQDFPGRFNSIDIWVEAAPPDAERAEGMPFRDLNDGVTPVVIGGNDWAAAWAVDEFGNWLAPVGRGSTGERQRELALRFGVNLIMHVLTGNYKSDQVHVPALLDRLGQ